MAKVLTHRGNFSGDGKNIPSNWKLGNKIGQGVSTVVYKVVGAQASKTGNIVVKQISIKRKHTDTRWNEIHQKIKALMQVDHEFLVKTAGYSRTDLTFSLFMPLVVNATGDKAQTLAEYLKRHEKIRESRAATLTYQLLEGLVYLHSNEIIHMDLKPSNIFMIDENNVKVTDYGVSKVLTELYKPERPGTGAINWMAPEMLNNSPCNEKVDIWSLGWTTYQMVTGKIPFGGLENIEIVSRAQRGQLILPNDLILKQNEKLKDFLTLTCEQNSSERPTAEVLEKNPLFVGIRPEEEVCLKEFSTRVRGESYSGAGH